MSARRVIGVALGILLVAFLVLVPKFVVSQSPETQFDTCDTIFAVSKQYIPPC
jgi:hypothetical protein